MAKVRLEAVITRISELVYQAPLFRLVTLMCCRLIFALNCRIGGTGHSSFRTVYHISQKAILYEIRHYKDIDGWLSPDEAAVLYLLSMLLPIRSTVVEIGSWKGKSTYCLAKGLPRGGHVFAIDPFDASGEADNIEVYKQFNGEIPLLDQFRENMTRQNVMTRITPIKGFSHQFVGEIPRIDLLFIDGDHSIKACDFDFSNYSSCIPPSGYLAFHDFDRQKKDSGPTWVVENKVLPSKEYEFLSVFGSVWVGRRL